MRSQWQRRGVIIVLVALATLVGTRVSRADGASVASAEATYARGALRAANRLFLASLREPGHTREELVRIHLHLGIIAGASGAERTSSAHFAIALALEPTLPTPVELAGRDRARFEQARPARPLAVSIVAPAHTPPGHPITIDMELSNAPPHTVDHLELTCGGQSVPVEAIGRGTELRGGRATVSPDTCPGSNVTIVATARNAFGGVLAHHEAHVSRGGGPR